MKNGTETNNGAKPAREAFPDNSFTDEELDDIIKEKTLPGSSIPESLASPPLNAAGCILMLSWLVCSVFFLIGLVKGELWCLLFFFGGTIAIIAIGTIANRWEKRAEAARDRKLATILRAQRVEKAYYDIKEQQAALYGTPDIAFRLYCQPTYKYLDPKADIDIYREAGKILLDGKIFSFSELTDFRLTETAKTKNGNTVILSEISYAEAKPCLRKLGPFEFAPADDDKDNPEIDFLLALRKAHATSAVPENDIKERRYTGEALTSRADCPVLHFVFSDDAWTADETARLLYLAIAQGRAAQEKHDLDTTS